MPGTKLNIYLYFKDMKPDEVNSKFPSLLPNIKKAKDAIDKLNVTKDMDGNAIVAQYHYCEHDIQDHEPCEWISI